MIRFYSWQAAWHVFLDHPILGVGYACFRFVSQAYHGLPFVIGTAESLFLEVAAGMGVVGLVALGIAIRRMFQLGKVIRRVTPANTFGHQLARYHAPFMISLLVANLTGDNWTGLVGLGQLAIWFALLVRAGHIAVREAGAA
jgi:O-antigen ligase